MNWKKNIPCWGDPGFITANPGTDGPCRLNPITLTPLILPVEILRRYLIFFSLPIVV